MTKDAKVDLDSTIRAYTKIMLDERAKADAKPADEPTFVTGPIPNWVSEMPEWRNPIGQTTTAPGAHLAQVDRRIDELERRALRHGDGISAHDKALKHQVATNAGQDEILARFANTLADLTKLCDKQATQIAKLQDRVDLIDSDLVLLRKKGD